MNPLINQNNTLTKRNKTIITSNRFISVL